MLIFTFRRTYWKGEIYEAENPKQISILWHQFSYPTAKGNQIVRSAHNITTKFP